MTNQTDLSLLPHGVKVAMYCFGYLDELREKGLIHAGHVVTDSGAVVFNQLRSEGFLPSKDEIKKFVFYLVGEDPEEVEIMLKLFYAHECGDIEDYIKT